ncbi:MAG: hypothetical protein WD646_01040 [Actinomycetota bacterium]
MCRIPKVVIVAPEDKQLELRKTLGSLEYDIVATVASADEATEIGCDVVVIWEPDALTMSTLTELESRTVAIGGAGEEAEMRIDPDDVASFKTRIWELFKPR